MAIARAGRATTFPARFQLVAAMNPCPCGFAGVVRSAVHVPDARPGALPAARVRSAARPDRPVDLDAAGRAGAARARHGTGGLGGGRGADRGGPGGRAGPSARRPQRPADAAGRCARRAGLERAAERQHRPPRRDGAGQRPRDGTAPAGRPDDRRPGGRGRPSATSTSTRPPGSGRPTCGSPPSRRADVLGVGDGRTGRRGVASADRPRAAAARTPRRPSRRTRRLGGPRRRRRARTGRVRRRCSAVRQRVGDPARGAVAGRPGRGWSRPPRDRSDGRAREPRRARRRRSPTAIAEARAERADATLERIRELGLPVVTVEDPAYPRRLAAIEMPPHVLFVLGDPAALERRRRGRRSSGRAGRPTRGGRLAARIAASLVAVGATVVSGLAVGIDGAAHAAASTPAARRSRSSARATRSCTRAPTRRLADAIVAAGGAVVSELAPDVAPTRGHLPAPEPGHQRPGRRHGRGRGTGPQRRAHHRVVGARAGSRLLPRARAHRRAGVRRLPGVPARVPGRRPDRGRDPAAHRRPRPRPTASPSPASRPARRPRSPTSAAARAGSAASSSLGRATVDELVAVTGLARRDRPRRRSRCSSGTASSVGVHGRYRPAGGSLRRTRRRVASGRARIVTRLANACRGLPGATAPVLPSPRSLPPDAARAPLLDGSPDHEQERLLRQGRRRAAGRPDPRRRLRRRAAAPLDHGPGQRRARPGGRPRRRRRARPVGRARPPRRRRRADPAADPGGVRDGRRDRRGLAEPVTIDFSAPMDAASVARAVTVDPPTAGRPRLGRRRHDADDRPDAAHWAPGTSTRSRSRPVRSPDRAAPARPGPRRLPDPRRDDRHASPRPRRLGTRVGARHGVHVDVRQPVDPATVGRGDPARPAGRRAPSSPTQPGRDGPAPFTFTPTTPLAPDTRYRLIVAGVRDADGLPLDPISLAVRTIDGAGGRPLPAARRHARRRPRRRRSRSASPTAMDRAARRQGVHGRRPAARRSRARSAGPRTTRSSSSRPRRRCRTARRSSIDGRRRPRRARDGAPLAEPREGMFRTVPSRAATAPRRPARGDGGSGGVRRSAAAARSVAAAGPRSRRYYLGLMNCTRTGGWVTSTGQCSSPGGRNVAPLRLERGISSKVSRPYAKRLAIGSRVQPLHRRQPGRPAAPRRLHELHAGPRTSAAGRATHERRPRLAPVLPEREVVQRRPLREPDERRVRPRRDRRLGVAAGGSAS